MGHGVAVTVDGATLLVDGRDVAAWAGRAWVESDRELPPLAEEYVSRHPRPDRKRVSGVAAPQRVALLRKLAVGPARRGELLAAMRSVGWVGADDFENRLRDLRATDAATGAHLSGAVIANEGDRYWLEAPFPLLANADRRALGFNKAMIQDLDGPLAQHARTALEGLLPGLAAASGDHEPVRYRAPVEAYQRFDAAMTERRPVKVRYFSLNSGREWTYNLVPRQYVTLGSTVKALCVPVTALGKRADDDRQFALDRLIDVDELADWVLPKVKEVQLHRSTIRMRVTDGLYHVMTQRNIFGIAGSQAELSEYDDQTWLVNGMFPQALGWDVMEQLCAWGGSVQVLEPFWLVNAVLRRLRAGLRVMESGGPFELVKPEPDRGFASLGEAIAAEEPLPPPTGPTKLPPPR